MNGKAGPATTPALCKLGERVRLRFVNLGMDHHPVHLHGHTWVVTGTEGGRIPAAAWAPGNTEIVGVAQARTMELTASNPGDWMIHCHLPHHMMNAMASRVGPLAEPGRGGVSAEQPVSHVVGPAAAPAGGGHGGHQQGGDRARPEATPGYPQDMFMAMDDEVAKPETHGLRRSWTGGMMGMMTLLRVLPPEKYEEIQVLKARQEGNDVRGDGR
jgi:manganese oxidase